MVSYADFVKQNKNLKKEKKEDNERANLRRDTILAGLSFGRFFLPGDELKPEAENNQKLSNIESAMTGIASGMIKVPEGIVSLGAELIDRDWETKSSK